MSDLIQWCNNNQGFLNGCLTFVYVAATIWLVRLSHQQTAHGTALEQNRIRPYVIFDLVIERHCVFAQIENIGQTPARNVKVTISPELRCMFAWVGEREQPEKGQPITFIERGVAMMAPRRSIKALAEHFAPFSRAYPKLRFEGQVAYTDSAGKSYSEPFIADLSAEENLFSRGIRDIEDVAEQLERIARTLDRFATGSDKPLVRVVTEEQHRAEEVASVEQAKRLFEQNDLSTVAPAEPAASGSPTES